MYKINIAGVPQPLLRHTHNRSVSHYSVFMSIQENTCIHSDDNEPDKDSGGENDGVDDEGYAGWWLCSQCR